MSKTLTKPLEADVHTFIALLRQKGDPTAAREIGKLVKAVRNKSEIIDTRVSGLMKNAFSEASVNTDLTEADRVFVSKLMTSLAAWRVGPGMLPGRKTDYAGMVHVRVNAPEYEFLNRTRDETGETYAEIVRRVLCAAIA